LAKSARLALFRSAQAQRFLHGTLTFGGSQYTSAHQIASFGERHLYVSLAGQIAAVTARPHPA